MPNMHWHRHVLLLCVLRSASGSFHPQTVEELRSALIAWEEDVTIDRSEYGSIDTWDVSSITNMSALFKSLSVNQAIGTWNTVAVTNMEKMFYNASAFNQDIGTWNTLAVKDMQDLFGYASTFNQAVGAWNTLAVTTMQGMFYGTPAFNQAIGTWNTVTVTDMDWMFCFASSFNQAIGMWNTMAVKGMQSMFYDSPAFNQAIGTWNTAVVADMKEMFKTYSTSAFNQAIGTWNTVAVTSMIEMFSASAFNQAIGTWDTGRVTAMNWQFYLARAFDQPIGTWNTWTVNDMSGMMSGTAAFNQDIGTWNTGRVKDMRSMFFFASAFNQTICNWSTVAVTTMHAMFSGCLAFNQTISTWNTVAVTDMSKLFCRASAFNQAICTWNTVAVIAMERTFAFASSFNQAVGTWNTAAVITMQGMFQHASVFNQAITTWQLSNLAIMENLFSGASGCYSEFAPVELSKSPSMNGMLLLTSVRLCPSSSFFLMDRYFLSIVVLASCICCCVLRGQIFACRCSLWKARVRARLRGRSILRDIVSLPVVDSGSGDPMARGRDLHSRVPASKWCITRDDLDLFEHEVFCAWTHGEIPNGSGDFANELHEDPRFGPTMYKVNEYFIKPITAMYGGMSFALLLHPEGLDCDCFATHAWSEGVFEFCAKLRRGWPTQCKNMYVCFLANPQNLDISALLDVPIQNSPFAMALSNASHMVVVSNRSCSIYSRLWCCYEAYLAYMLNKTIVLPRGRILVGWVYKRICLCTIVIACSFLLARSARAIFCLAEDSQRVSSYCSWDVIENMSMLLTEENGQVRGNATGFHNFIISGTGKIGQTLFLRMFSRGASMDCVAVWNESKLQYSAEVWYDDSHVFKRTLCFYDLKSDDDFKCWRTTLWMACAAASFDALLVLMMIATKWGAFKHVATSVAIGSHLYLCVALYCYNTNTAVDRSLTSLAFLPLSTVAGFLACWIAHSVLRYRTQESRKEEVAQLSFTRLTEATCSDKDDEKKILKVLANRESEVEEALRTLMLQGMSTCELRHLASRRHSSGYPLTGLFLVATLIWPCHVVSLYVFGVSFHLSNYLHRMHMITIATVLILNFLIWQAWLYYDADLSNVGMKAGILAWAVACVCGGVVGHWGVVGGVASAACYIAHHRGQIQRTEFDRFLASLLPVNIFFGGFLLWETLATFISGSSCIHVLQEFFGICGCSIFLAMAGRAYFSDGFERVASASGTIFVGCCSASCILTAINLANARRNRFFRADEIPFHRFMSLQAHYTLGITSLTVIGFTCPFFLLWERTLHSRTGGHSLTTEIELQAL